MSLDGDGGLITYDDSGVCLLWCRQVEWITKVVLRFGVQEGLSTGFIFVNAA